MPFGGKILTVVWRMEGEAKRGSRTPAGRLLQDPPERDDEVCTCALRALRKGHLMPGGGDILEEPSSEMT